MGKIDSHKIIQKFYSIIIHFYLIYRLRYGYKILYKNLTRENITKTYTQHLIKIKERKHKITVQIYIRQNCCFAMFIIISRRSQYNSLP